MGNAKRPGILYHYTTAQGLTAILGEGRIRASDCQFLNDGREIVYVQKRLARYLRRDEVADPRAADAAAVLAEMAEQRDAAPLWSAIQAGKKAGASDDEVRLGEAVMRALNRNRARMIIDSTDDDARPDVFVTCFSKRRDDLSQWRAYGDYAIGFWSDALDPIWSVSQARLAKVEYGKNTATEKELLAMVDALLVEDSMPPRVIRADTSHPFIERMARVKHRSFEHEREWRLIHVGNGPKLDVRLREAGNGLLVPFIEVQAPASSIAEVWVGPGSAEQHESKTRALRRLLTARCVIDAIPVPDVHVSKSPFR